MTQYCTEWDEWDSLVEKGYRAQTNQDSKELILAWWKAWDIFQRILNWSWGNAGEHKKHMEFCRKILDLLD